jgi:hypothetical protein
MFEIDTGRPQGNPQGIGKIDRAQVIMDAALDSLQENPAQADIDAALTAIIISELQSPKTAQTVRRRLCQLWRIIAPMAETSPDCFDAILTEYAAIIS